MRVRSKLLANATSPPFTMQSTRVLFGLGVVVAALAAIVPSEALAAPPADASASAPLPAVSPAEPAKAAAGSPGSSKKISLDDDFLIEGELEKPSAFLLFRRSDLNYDWARLEVRFSPLVLESVQDPLF